jgi:hypothetical protein
MIQQFDRTAADLDALKDRIAEFAQQLEINPTLDGALVESENMVAATPRALNHKLGRQPRGWILTDIDAAATVHRTAWDDKTISLEASANATVSVWVF